MATAITPVNKIPRRPSFLGNRRFSLEKAQRSDSLRNVSVRQIENLPLHVLISPDSSPMKKSSMKYATHKESIRREFGSGVRSSLTEDSTVYDSDDCAGDDGPKQNSELRNVGWHKVEIREYGRTVGDNPSVSGGPPITLSWTYHKAFEGSVDAYENDRPVRHVGKEMAVPRYLREIMLCEEWGCSNREIANAVRDILAIKQQRRTTVNRLEMRGAAMMEEKAEHIIRSLRHGYCGKQREILQWDNNPEDSD